MAATRLDCALDLLLRLPPQQLNRNLRQVTRLTPDLADDLYSAIDQSLRTKYDVTSGRDFLCCEYNRDGNSHRSPWSNRYYPPIENGCQPPPWLRELERTLNEAFRCYLELYYDGGTSSVYLWPLEDGRRRFAAAILLKKQGQPSGPTQGCWDSIHVAEVEERTDSVTYTLTSAIMLWLRTNKHVSGQMNIGGSISRQTTRTVARSRSQSHVVQLGELVEETENHMRSTLYEVYFWRSKDIVTRLLRCSETVQCQQVQRSNSRMLDTTKSTIRRSPSGKHLLVPDTGDTLHV